VVVATDDLRSRAAELRAPVRIDGYAPIADYAVIGDGRTVALVAADGAIDWLAMPNIASEPVLTALLDAQSGHSFRLAPVGDVRVTRRYLPETNVLETTFHAPGGVLEVTDAFATDDGELLPWLELVRSVRCVAGSVEVEWRFAPSPDADGRYELHTWSAGHGRFRLSEGERALFALVFVVDGPLPALDRHDLERRLRSTADWWERWVERHEYDGPWAGEVLRSALSLKLLTHSPTGAMAAAATTSLPEKIGGDRNWDYRFSWVRDSAWALDALLRIGRLELVHSALRWLLDAVERTHPRLNVLYDLAGGVPDSCEELPLPGYRGSRPVRKGNAAAPQLQLGCYGDLLETVWLYVRDGNDLGPDIARRIAEVASFTCRIWENEDSGIWELDDLRHYTISKMGCWMALDRAIRLAERGAIPGRDAGLWRSEQGRIRDFVETRCWSEERGSYTFYAGSDKLDASVLLAARNGFADPQGERMAGTIAAIREELVEGPFVYRYSGARELEGAFLACSFWLVQALARCGRVDEARELMDEVVALSNDVGLFSEEVDPDSRELLGNHPQALTHLALIDAAGAVADAEGS
jgi:GH15 family glucan-1,4-alpha-glucosidase